MSSSLKFVKDILLYSGGPVVGRIATLFLLPLTTSYLTPNDYGLIAILTLLPIFMNGLFSLGFHTSLGRVYSTGKDELQKEGIIWTAHLTLFLNNLLMVGLAILLSHHISNLLFDTPMYRDLVSITFIGIGICTMRMALEYYLRAQLKSKKVFALNLIDATASISIMLLEVIYLQKGARGYMEAFAIAQTINLVVVSASVVPKLRFSIQWHTAKELVKIGIPCIYGYWGYCILQGASRYLLQIFSTEDQVGLYFLGSNLGRIIELPLWGFMSAWVPYFNSYIHKKEEAPPIFSQALTYYLLSMGCLIAPLFCFARPFVHLFLQAPFQEVWKVVGLTGMAQALWGAYAITYPPLVFYKKTGIQSCLELGAAFLCILANLALIPFFSIEGAALATLFGFIALVAMSIQVNQRWLKVPYQWPLLLKFGLAFAIVAACSFVPLKDAWLYNLGMTANLIVFYAYCWIGLLSSRAKEMLKAVLKKPVLQLPKIS